MIVAAIELLERQPRAGFNLLAQWGPWPIVALTLAAILGSFLARLNETVSATFSSIVDSAKEGVQAQGRMADAVTKLAEQGGRQSEEVRRLAIYAAREFPGVYERLDKQDLVLDEVLVAVKDIQGKLPEGTKSREGRLQ